MWGNETVISLISLIDFYNISSYYMLSYSSFVEFSYTVYISLQ